MAEYATINSSHHNMEKTKNDLQKKNCNEDFYDYRTPRWHFSKKEIEECSPSRFDGIDLKKENSLRKSYSTFLQDLGMRLRVPQVTIATAIVLCHRFFVRQSHGKNDRRTIATVCMFLAGKVEETPRPLKDLILSSFEIIHKNGPFDAQKMNKEVFERQKELILIAEKLVLATLAFDLSVQHPYRSLVDAIKNFKVAKNALAKVAWNFLNDGLRTSLSLEFKPKQIAAAAIFLAAKFIKVKLPSHGDDVWWQPFNVTPRQLEDISNQMLELYEQNHHPTATNTQKNNMENEKMNFPKSHYNVEKCNLWVNKRTEAKFVNENEDEDCKEEGEICSIDELQDYNPQVSVGVKRNSDEVSSRDFKRSR